MSKAASASVAENAAVRKLIYSLAELNGDDVNPNEISMVEAAGDALENVDNLVNRVEKLESECDTLSSKLEAVEERSPSPSEKDYKQMDKSDKATVIREKMMATAQGTNGRAYMHYKDVMAVFDGRPSAGHAYDIMDCASNGDGFNLGKNAEGKKRLTFNRNKTTA